MFGKNVLLLNGMTFLVFPIMLHGFTNHGFTKCSLGVTGGQRRSMSLCQAKKKGNEKSGGGGGLFSNYKFGDLFINKLTGKDEYQFGDLSKFLDQKAKEKVNELTGNDEYTFGDLSRFADARIKEKVNNFTGKEAYQVGDVSKEILRRVAQGDYKVEDIVLLCKVLASFGVGLSPVASALPSKLLLEMLNVSLGQEIGSRLLEALSVTVDQRFKEAFTGDKDYKVGDITKRAVLNFVGKDEGDKYEFGEITKTIAKRLEEANKQEIQMKKFGETESHPGKGSYELDPKLVAELEKLDLARNASATID